MIRLRSRWVFAALSAVALSQAPMLTAHATGSCITPTPFVSTTSGTVGNGGDWWLTPGVGTTTITLQSDDATAFLQVSNASCLDVLCEVDSSYVLECTVPYTGELTIVVGTVAYGHTMNYTLTTTPTDPTTAPLPQCSDNIDNDLNGQTDYPNDPGCATASDPIEASTPTTCTDAAGVPVCVNVVNGEVVRTVTVAPVETSVGATHDVAGTVDIYKFALPTGGTTTVPCVVLSADSVPIDACRSAGGTFVSRVATLFDGSVNQPSASLGIPVGAINVCSAQVTITVAGVGVEDIPAYSIC
jgi:hypothetical protein